MNGQKDRNQLETVDGALARSSVKVKGCFEKKLFQITNSTSPKLGIKQDADTNRGFLSLE